MSQAGAFAVASSEELAKQADETVIVEGDQIVVSGAEGTTLRVRLV